MFPAPRCALIVLWLKVRPRGASYVPQLWAKQGSARHIRQGRCTKSRVAGWTWRACIDMLFPKHAVSYSAPQIPQIVGRCSHLKPRENMMYTVLCCTSLFRIIASKVASLLSYLIRSESLVRTRVSVWRVEEAGRIAKGM